MTTWLQHVEDWKDCRRCPLGEQRSNICLARGVLPCDVLYVGEAPGVIEDMQALPFVGPAGDLLNQIDERALPADVRRAFCNLVACFPADAKQRGDHRPERGEILECRPRLTELVNLAQPRLIVRVGRLAQDYCGFDGRVPFVDIVHPAFILARMPPVQKRSAANDCAVQIRCAWDRVTEQPMTAWEEWGKSNASGEAKQRQLRELYDEHAARGERHPDDEIPY